MGAYQTPLPALYMSLEIYSFILNVTPVRLGCLVLSQGLSAGDSVKVGTEKATENVESGKGSEEHCVAR